MKKTVMIAVVVVAGSLLLSILYSCVKETIGQEESSVQPATYSKGVYASYTDSSCKVCSEQKTATLTPESFLPINIYGAEMLAKRGRATISDAEVQPYKRLNVTIKSANGWHVAIPLFHMAADGSYESISYDYASSVLLINYVRYNKANNTFTYKPVNNLEVKYATTMMN